MREDVLKRINENKIVVILRGVDSNKILPLSKALYDGGIRILEVTYDQTKKISDEETSSNIKMLKEYYKDSMSIGAGTVLTIEQVKLTKEAGGEFILSPNVNKEVIEETRKLSMVSIPGALTPTEIENAHLYGADIVKVFPAGDMGPNYIKSITAPLSHIKLMLTGGISYENIKDYKKLKNSSYGIGSNIVNKEMLNNENYSGITELAKKYIEEIKE